MKIVIILTTLKQWNPCHQEKENKKEWKHNFKSENSNHRLEEYI